MKRRRAVISCFLISSIFLAEVFFTSCSSQKAKEGQEVVTILLDGQPLTLNPNAHREVLTRSVLSNCFEGLVGFDADMRVVPLLAARWENPDDLTWVFTLRQGVRFHNGKTMDARAVVRSILSVVKWDSSGRGMWSIDTVYSSGKGTVVVRTRKPDAILLNRLTKVYIVSKEPEYRFHSDTGYVPMPAGTGPYTIDYWHGDSMGMNKWDKYWGGNQGPARLKFLFRQDRTKLKHLCCQGAIDIVPNLKVEELRYFGNVKGMFLKRREGLVVRYLKVEPEIEPYKNHHIRKAISLAIDRQGLVDSLVGGYGQPASQMVTPVIFGYNPDLPPLRYDPDSARFHILQAGYRWRRPRLILDALEARMRLGRMIKEQLERAGFACSLRLHPRDEFFRGSGLRSGFFLSAVATNTGDASGTLALGGLDSMGQGVMNPTERQRILQQAMQMFTDQLEYIPLFSEDDISLVSERIDWHPRQDMMVLGKEMVIRK